MKAAVMPKASPVSAPAVTRTWTDGFRKDVRKQVALMSKAEERFRYYEKLVKKAGDQEPASTAAVCMPDALTIMAVPVFVISP